MVVTPDANGRATVAGRHLGIICGRFTYTDEFQAWWDTLDVAEQESLLASVRLLQSVGPTLGRPHVDTIHGSRHGNMKELRTQHAGRPYRTFFAFDPQRWAVLLIRGDKTGDDRFYERMVPLADQIFDAYIREPDGG